LSSIAIITKFDHIGSEDSIKVRCPICIYVIYLDIIIGIRNIHFISIYIVY
jgi:hypothetical protein